VKCVIFVSETFTRYGSNITNVWQKIVMPMILELSCNVVHEKLWKSINICKSYGGKISGTFFMWTQISTNTSILRTRYHLGRQGIELPWTALRPALNCSPLHLPGGMGKEWECFQVWVTCGYWHCVLY